MRGDVEVVAKQVQSTVGLDSLAKTRYSSFVRRVFLTVSIASPISESLFGVIGGITLGCQSMTGGCSISLANVKEIGAFLEEEEEEEEDKEECKDQVDKDIDGL